jgi:hypothetical protein
MFGGERAFDGILAAEQPIHRGVDLIGGRAGHPQISAQSAIGPPAQGGQLACRPHHPGDDQGQHQITRPARLAQQRGQAQLVCHRRHRGDMPVRQRPGDAELATGRHQLRTLEASVDPVNDMLG